jgi:predicted Fe-S protein YdhL (DUF1289 family)
MSKTNPQSPCIDVCVMGSDGYCRGCYRTIEEIARWRSMSKDEQKAVWRMLRERAALEPGVR